MEKGYFQIYTGEGKGKTTASLGLALRAVGGGFRVYIGQFIKDDNYSEVKIIKQRFPEITLEQYGSGSGYLVDRKANDNDYIASTNGYKKAKEALLSKKYDLVILDEINIALSLAFLTKEEAIDLIRSKPENVELVFTGRNAMEEIIEHADLVSVISERKHYYKQGIMSRLGIEK